MNTTYTSRVPSPFQVNRSKPYQVSKPENKDVATPKQVDYLRQLISVNFNEEDRENMEAQLGEMTKSEASDMIASFKR